MGSKRLSKVINYDRDIKDHHMITIRAGCGAGKNFWAKQLGEQDFRILLITSRSVTADAQAEKLKAARWIDISHLCASEYWGEEPDNVEKRVVCTNAGIETFIRRWYDPKNPKTHIWNYYDFIILDEAHSIVSDASFADSCFYVERFIDRAYHENLNCHIVLMSATLEPIQWMLDESGWKIHNLNKFDECIHLEPKKVCYYPKVSTVSKLLYHWKRGERIVYFANSVSRIEDLVKRMKEQGVPESDMGISYSTSNGKERDFSDSMKEQMEVILESLKTEELLPPEVKIFFTTTKNKEGININNEDLKIMFSESHQKSELIQMAGRIRNGLDELWVCYDASEHRQLVNGYENLLDKNCLPAIRESVKEYVAECEKYGIEPNMKRVMESNMKFPNIRYDVLTNDYYYFRSRAEGYRQQKRDQHNLKQYIESLNEPVFHVGNGCYVTGYDMLKDWFPYSECVVYETKVGSQQYIQEKVDHYLKQQGFLAVILDREQRAALVKDLNKLLSQFDRGDVWVNLPFDSPGPMLKKFGYRIEGVGKNGTKWIINPREEEQKAG